MLHWWRFHLVGAAALSAAAADDIITDEREDAGGNSAGAVAEDEDTKIQPARVQTEKVDEKDREMTPVGVKDEPSSTGHNRFQAAIPTAFKVALHDTLGSKQTNPFIQMMKHGGLDEVVDTIFGHVCGRQTVKRASFLFEQSALRVAAERRLDHILPSMSNDLTSIRTGSREVPEDPPGQAMLHLPQAMLKIPTGFVDIDKTFSSFPECGPAPRHNRKPACRGLRIVSVGDDTDIHYASLPHVDFELEGSVKPSIPKLNQREDRYEIMRPELIFSMLDQKIWSASRAQVHTMIITQVENADAATNFVEEKSFEHSEVLILDIPKEHPLKIGDQSVSGKFSVKVQVLGESGSILSWDAFVDNLRSKLLVDADSTGFLEHHWPARTDIKSIWRHHTELFDHPNHYDARLLFEKQLILTRQVLNGFFEQVTKFQ